MGARYHVEKRADDTVDEPPLDLDVLGARQAAAACLRAARQTRDPAERDALRRQAADLLSPRARGRARGSTSQPDSSLRPGRSAGC